MMMMMNIDLSIITSRSVTKAPRIEMLVVESILHHWVDIDDAGTLLDDKLLLPGVFSGQSYCCFCFLVVVD